MEIYLSFILSSFIFLCFPSFVSFFCVRVCVCVSIVVYYFLLVVYSLLLVGGLCVFVFHQVPIRGVHSMDPPMLFL